MERRILIITCCFIFSGCCSAVEETPQEKSDGDPAIEQLIESISELAAKVLEMFEPIATKSNNDMVKEQDNTYLVSFLLKDGKNNTETPKQRMIVNNNFNGERLGSNQVFVESGPPPKQAPSHNIQLLNNARPERGVQAPSFRQFPQFQQQQQQGFGQMQG